ncbi:MAG: chaperonin GroES [Patescibacteria group bacterium]|nr:chaperonin GroES [Patescibacteria group bacterium]
MKIKPLSDKVVVKLLEAKEMTSGGIYLPETGQEESHVAEVMAVGDGRVIDNGTLVKPGVQVGQKVVIRGKWAGDNVTVDGVEYKVVGENDVLAILED